MTPPELLPLIVLGIATGALGGALGVGGGFILVPVFHVLMGWPLIEAVAASQFCILASSISSAHRYSLKGLVDHRLGVVLGSTTILGAAVGAYSVDFIPEQVLIIMFAALTLLAGIRMWRSRPTDDHESGDVRSGARLRIGMVLSSLVGFAAAVLGLGGGALQVPIMHDYLRVPVRIATATSAFIIGLTATTSAAVYFHKGDLRIEEAAMVALGVLFGAFLGAAGQHRVPVAVLRRSFSVILLILSIRMLIRVFGW